jgi:hypothetical protein
MNGRGITSSSHLEKSALTGLEAWVGLVDDVNPATPTHQLVVTVTLDQRLKRIANFHFIT